MKYNLTKDRQYFIVCDGPFEYNKFRGTGRYTGKTEVLLSETGEEILHEFEITHNNERLTTLFCDEDVVSDLESRGEYEA